MNGFSDHATWLGTPIHEMSKADILLAFAYKARELRECYCVMSREQNKQVRERMSKVPVPLASTETKDG